MAPQLQCHRLLVSVLFDDLDDVPAVGIGALLERIGRALGPREPLGRLVVAAELLEHGRVGVEQRGAPSNARSGSSCGICNSVSAASGCPRSSRAPDIAIASSTCTGTAQLGARHGTPELERPIGTTDAPLAVDHQRQLVVAAGDAAVGAQLAQREREVAGRVGGDRDGLAHDADAAGATCRREGVPVGERGILVDQARRP